MLRSLFGSRAATPASTFRSQAATPASTFGSRAATPTSTACTPDGALRFLTLLFVALVSLAPERASAQQGGADLRLGIGGVLDFAGEVEADFPGPGGSPNDDLKLTPGLRVHLDYDIHRYVSIGGLARFSFWESDDDWEDRSLLVDIMLRVAGHYDWRDFRFYVALTIGPTISKLRVDDQYGDVFDNPAVGVAAGLTPGAEWWFSRRAALFLEMFGWNGHYFSHEFADSNRDVNFSLNQVSWQLGFVLAL